MSLALWETIGGMVGRRLTGYESRFARAERADAVGARDSVDGNLG